MAKQKTPKTESGANEFIIKPGVSAWGDMVNEADDNQWAEMVRKKTKERGSDYKPPTREESRKKAQQRAKTRASKVKNGKAATGKGFTLLWPWPRPGKPPQ